jgi:hypothetical protein
MTGFLRQLLIGHFGDPDNIEEPLSSAPIAGIKLVEAVRSDNR